MRRFFILFLAVVLMLAITGCSAKSQAMGSVDNMEYAEIGSDKPAEAPAEKTESVLPENRKLIQTLRITAEVQELDPALADVESRIAEQGGYVENSNIYHGGTGSRSRNASLTIRIPADRLNDFTQQISAVSNVIFSNKSVDDVTLSYVATESRMNALKTEETRLLELLAQAENMEDLLAIESRLTDVRTELEQVTSALRVYDNQVDYATVYLDISEVKIYTVTEEPESVGERMGTGFVNSLKNLWKGITELAVFFVANLPFILLFGTVAVVIILVVRKKKSKKKAE